MWRHRMEAHNKQMTTPHELKSAEEWDNQLDGAYRNVLQNSTNHDPRLIIRAIQDNAIRWAVDIAKAHRGSAARDRKPMRDLDPAVWDAIRSEERGENIASDMIAKAILKAWEERNK